MCKLSYELMQSLKPNSAFNYQSLDLPFHYCCNKLADRVFKYKYSLKLDKIEFEENIGDIVRQRDDWNKMASEGIKRNGFFEGIAINGRKTNYYFQFPLYKTVEKHEFKEE